MRVLVIILAVVTAALGQIEPGDSGCGNEFYQFGNGGDFTSMNFDPDNNVNYDANALFECDSEVAYRCGDDENGYCIPIEERCDGVQDCALNEDELGCPVNSFACGRQEIEPVLIPNSQGPPSANIVGGDEAAEGSWPWVVSIVKSFEYICTGTILNRRWVLTAASCVFTYQNNPLVFDIVSGEHNIMIEDPYEKSHDVNDIYIHPNYSPLKEEWNFALLEIRGQIVFNDPVTLDICLPNVNDIFPGGTETWVAGWGDTAPEVENLVLNQANVTLESDEYCNDPSRHNGDVTESLLCGGTDTVDACVGDDGGPMMWYRPIQDEQDPNPDDERWYLIGVTGDRTRHGCVNPDKPGLYGKVSSRRRQSKEGTMRVFVIILAVVTAALGQVEPGDSGCGNELYQFEDGGDFTSMNFDPDNNVNYDANAFCEWVLQTSVDLGQAIELNFEYFAVEKAVNCVHDSVIAYDGYTSEDPILRVMCGHSIPNPTISSATVMHVEFITDSSVQYPGFSATWRAREQPIECESEVGYRCGDDENGYCIPIEERCDGVQHCSLGEDELGCPKNSFACGRQEIEPVLIPNSQGSPSANIIGGYEAVEGSWPWVVSIERSFEYKCTGTILNRHWILTSASCVFTYHNNPLVFDIVSGEHNIMIEDPYEKSHDVNEIYIHPNYSPLKDEWNFALLEIRGQIVFRNNPATLDICLPNDNDIFPGDTETVVAGWGDTAPEVENLVLNQANVTLESDEYCNDPSRHNGTVTESLLCGGTGTVDACVGDDGGPMMWYRPIQDELDPNEDDERWYLIGVTGDRTRHGCTNPDKPGLYGKVSSVISWIESTIL
ncbi:ovochymase-2-like [Glandiceps talaboti]